MGMGMSPSTYDLFMALAYSMTVLMVGLGVTGLIMAASRSVSSEVIRTLSWIYLAWVTVFTLVGYYYRVPPPLISGVVIGVALVVGLVLPAKSSEEPAPVNLSKHANQTR
jgi:predicted membrane channel-forming protein YqfA (hemolysin III family)